MKNNLEYSTLTEQQIREYLEKLFYERQERDKDKRRIKIFFCGTKKQFNKMMSEAMKEDVKRLIVTD